MIKKRQIDFAVFFMPERVAGRGLLPVFEEKLGHVCPFTRVIGLASEKNPCFCM